MKLYSGGTNFMRGVGLMFLYSPVLMKLDPRPDEIGPPPFPLSFREQHPNKPSKVSVDHPDCPADAPVQLASSFAVHQSHDARYSGTVSHMIPGNAIRLIEQMID